MRKRFDSVTVGLPAQAFEVRSHVSIERLVPVMTEFALRLVHILGPVSAEVTQAYFGLNARQMRALLGLLSAENLIEDLDDQLQLTSYALARFSATDQNTARFSRIVERVSHPTFELLTYTPLPKLDRIAEWDNSIPLSRESKGTPLGPTIDRIYDAYFKHFHDIERFASDQEEKRAIDVYKVDEVRAGRRINIPYPIHFEVDQDGAIEYAYEQEAGLPVELRQQLSLMTTEALSQIQPPKEGVRQFSIKFNDELISKYLQLKGFDFQRYVREIHAQGLGERYLDGETKPLFGATYLEETVATLVDQLKKASDIFRARHKGVRLNNPKLFWIAPKNVLWGRSQLLRDAVNALQEAGRSKFSATFSVSLVRPAPRGKSEIMRKEAATYLSAGFREVLFTRRDPGDDRIELMVLPGVFAAPLYHCTVPSTRAICAPIGHCTFNEKRLRAAQDFLFQTISSSESKAHIDPALGLVISPFEAAAFAHLQKIPQDRQEISADE